MGWSSWEAMRLNGIRQEGDIHQQVGMGPLGAIRRLLWPHESKDQMEHFKILIFIAQGFQQAWQVVYH